MRQYQWSRFGIDSCWLSEGFRALKHGLPWTVRTRRLRVGRDRKQTRRGYHRSLAGSSSPFEPTIVCLSTKANLMASRTYPSRKRLGQNVEPAFPRSPRKTAHYPDGERIASAGLHTQHRQDASLWDEVVIFKALVLQALYNFRLSRFRSKNYGRRTYVDNRTRIFGAPLSVGVFQHLSRGCCRRSEIARNPQTSQSGFEPAAIRRMSGGICLVSPPLVRRLLISREKVGHVSGRK